MENQKTIEEIYQSIKTNGLIFAMQRYFGVGARMQIPFTKVDCDTEIEQLDLSVRSYNCLKRAGIQTVRNVISAMHDDRLWKIRNLGKNSRAEIHVRIYEFGYQNLTEHEKRLFIKTALERNAE